MGMKCDERESQSTVYRYKTEGDNKTRKESEGGEGGRGGIPTPFPHSTVPLPIPSRLRLL